MAPKLGPVAENDIVPVKAADLKRHEMAVILYSWNPAIHYPIAYNFPSPPSDTTQHWVNDIWEHILG